MWLLAFCFEPVVESSWFPHQNLGLCWFYICTRNMILSFLKWCLNITDNGKKKERESKLHKLSVIVELKSMSLDLDSRNWNWHHELFPNLIACILYFLMLSWPLEIRPHLQSTMIDSFDIYLVCIILPPPPIRCVAIAPRKVGKVLTMVYALRSYWDPPCCLLHTPSPWLFKMHPLIWPSLILGWVLTRHHLFDQKEPMPK